MKGVEIFKPIVKEYHDAENGVTQGIEMTRRKSKDMVEYKVYIRKITLAVLFITFMSIVYANQWLKDLVDKFLVQLHGGDENGLEVTLPVTQNDLFQDEEGEQVVKGFL
jgi:hypothetical protein